MSFPMFANSTIYNASMIYYVEDDSNIRDLTIYALKSAGLEACGFERGEEFFEACKEEPPELVLLDVMLPGADGYEILDQIRRSQKLRKTPVMMLTAKGEEYDKVCGLNAGADDYLAKPFGMMELVARVNALLRRTHDKDERSLFTCGTIVVDDDTHTATASGIKVDLTFKEFGLLRLLCSHPSRVYSREQIMDIVWETDAMGATRTVDVHVQTLREKLKAADGASDALVKTVRGVGYCIKDD